MQLLRYVGTLRLYFAPSRNLAAEEAHRHQTKATLQFALEMSADLKLEHRVLRSLYIFQVLLALLLFLPAGTIWYWQAWIFWLVVGISNFAITYYLLRYDPALLRRRMAVGPRAEQLPSQKLIQTFTFIFLCALIIASGIDFRLHGSSLSMPVVVAAQTIYALSMGIVFMVFRQNSYAAATVMVEPEQRLVSSGLYSIVRHPMYSATVVAFFAIPLALGSYRSLLLAIPLAIALVMRLLYEERYLVTALSSYSAYRAQVKYRLIPGIW